MSDAMTTQGQINAARKVLEKKWQSEGECQSCGWHASLYQYEIDDDDIEDAIDGNGGLLYLPCLSRDCDDTYDHRGVRIQLTAVIDTESKND